MKFVSFAMTFLPGFLSASLSASVLPEGKFVGDVSPTSAMTSPPPSDMVAEFNIHNDSISGTEKYTVEGESKTNTMTMTLSCDSAGKAVLKWFYDTPEGHFKADLEGFCSKYGCYFDKKDGESMRPTTFSFDEQRFFIVSARQWTERLKRVD